MCSQRTDDGQNSTKCLSVQLYRRCENGYVVAIQTCGTQKSLLQKSTVSPSKETLQPPKLLGVRRILKASGTK